MVFRGEFYAGSRILKPVSDVVGLPIDQVNFLTCQVLGIILGVIFRKVFCPSKASPSLRLFVELVLGVSLTIFCFGHQILHLFLQSFMCYMTMKFASPHLITKAVFVMSMLYMSITHMYRQYYDYGGYTLDITGPLMIATQKVTSVAFSLHDGLYKDKEKLNKDQSNQAIRVFPSVLQYFSFIFYFQGIMCGPLSFYADYMAYIDGSAFKKDSKSSENTDNNLKHNNEKKLILFPENVELFQKFMVVVLLGVMMVALPQYVPYDYLSDDEFLNNTTVVYKTVYLFFCLCLLRYKYYFAWKLGELVNLASGFGFSGYDASGKATWNLLHNIDIWQVETSNSLKLNIDGWNRLTAVWLRRIVYERAPKFNTMSVFVVSAIWHGFYPGYYITFVIGALFTVAARLMRRNVRQYFQTSPRKAYIYDCITFMFTRIANAHMCVCFVILEFIPCMKLLLSMYMWIQVLSVLVIVYFTFIHPSKREKKQQ